MRVNGLLQWRLGGLDGGRSGLVGLLGRRSGSSNEGDLVVNEFD